MTRIPGAGRCLVLLVVPLVRQWQLPVRLGQVRYKPDIKHYSPESAAMRVTGTSVESGACACGLCLLNHPSRFHKSSSRVYAGLHWHKFAMLFHYYRVCTLCTTRACIISDH